MASVEYFMASSLMIYAFLGLVFGYFLGMIAPEEIKPGKTILNTLKNLVLFLIGVFILFSVPLDHMFYLFIVLGFFMGYLFKDYYFYFGVALWGFVGDLWFGVLTAVGIFIYGMVEGTLDYKKKMFLMHRLFFYFIPVFFVFILSYYIIFDYRYLACLFFGFLIKDTFAKK